MGASPTLCVSIRHRAAAEHRPPRRRSVSLAAVLRHLSHRAGNTFRALVGVGYDDRTGARLAGVGAVAIL